MTWKVAKKSLQPVAGVGWYVTNGPDDLHCGTGEEGEKRANAIMKLLNLGGASLPPGQSDYREKLMGHLRSMSDAALNIDPEIVQIPEGHPLHSVLMSVRKVKNEADEIQTLVLMGPSGR